MTTKKSNTKPVETVEVEAPVTEVQPATKPRLTGIERARLALEAAEAREAERRAKKLEAVLARRAATMAVVRSNHDKLAGVDNELEELIGHDAFVELALPGPVCDQWTDENSYFTLSNGRMETVAHVKRYYELQHGLVDATTATWPAYLEHEGKTYMFKTPTALEQAVRKDVPAALYGKDVTSDVGPGTDIEDIYDEDPFETVEIVSAAEAAELVSTPV